MGRVESKREGGDESQTERMSGADQDIQNVT